MPLPTSSMPVQQGTKKTLLTRPQVRILQALADTKGALNRNTICKRATLTMGILTYLIGRVRDGEANVSRAYSNGTPLIDLGYVIPIEIDNEGKDEIVYQITDSGRQALLGYQAKSTA